MAWTYTEEKRENFEAEKLPAKTYQGVIFAIYDLGMQKTSYQGIEKMQHKIRIGIELNKRYETGKYAGSRVTRYPKFTLSFYKSRLLTFVQAVLGRDMTDDEINSGGDVLIGKNLTVTLSYRTNPDGTESQYPNYSFGGLLDGVQPITSELGPDYMPDFIPKEIENKPTPSCGGDKILTKFEMFNKIQEAIKTNPELKKQWEIDYTKLGQSMSLIDDDKMSELYSKYVFGW